MTSRRQFLQRLIAAAAVPKLIAAAGALLPEAPGEPSFYISLWITPPGATTCREVSGRGYARQPIEFGPCEEGGRPFVMNRRQVTFQAMEDWGDITHAVIFFGSDAVVQPMPLISPARVQAHNICCFQPGSVRIACDEFGDRAELRTF